VFVVAAECRSALSRSSVAVCGIHSNTDSASQLTRLQAEQGHLKGNDLFNQKQYLKAVRAYTAALTHDPRNAVLFSNRSMAFIHLKEYREALLDALRLVRLKPNQAKVCTLTWQLSM
jgi:tetratricopeptide (TPR) repeat protein